MNNTVKVVRHEVLMDPQSFSPQLLLTLSLPMRLTDENNADSMQEQREMLANEILKAILEASQDLTKDATWLNDPPTGKEQI